MPTDQPLAGKRFLTFVGDIYEDLELWYPKLRLIEAGATAKSPAYTRNILNDRECKITAFHQTIDEMLDA